MKGLNMSRVVFVGNGIEVVERHSRLFIRYDAGELVPKMEEVEVTKSELEKAKISEKDAYEVLLAHQEP